MLPERYQIPPFSFRLDGATVTIYEVIKRKTITGRSWYYATVRISLGGFKSRVFGIDAKDEDEFKKKLIVEISKLKMLRMASGEREVVEVAGT